MDVKATTPMDVKEFLDIRKKFRENTSDMSNFHLKIELTPADFSLMKAIDETRAKFTNKRSSLRLTMLKEEPLYLQVTLDAEINLPVTELGGGGVRLLCYKCQQFFDGFYVGQSLRHSVLMLGEEGIHDVEPVIKWKKWPCIGVQFINLSDKDRAGIFKHLFKLERKKLKQMNMELEQKPQSFSTRRRF